MRQIKFRGKSIDDGQWVYGSLVVDTVTGRGCCVIEYADISEPNKGGGAYVWCDIIDGTAGQLAATINGVDFYEGDITNNGVIKFFEDLNWDSGGSYHPGFYFQGEYYSDDHELEHHISFDEDLELLGNIYDNPDRKSVV